MEIEIYQYGIGSRLTAGIYSRIESNRRTEIDKRSVRVAPILNPSVSSNFSTLSFRGIEVFVAWFDRARKKKLTKDSRETEREREEEKGFVEIVCRGIGIANRGSEC